MKIVQSFSIGEFTREDAEKKIIPRLIVESSYSKSLADYNKKYFPLNKEEEKMQRENLMKFLMREDYVENIRGEIEEIRVTAKLISIDEHKYGAGVTLEIEAEDNNATDEELKFAISQYVNDVQDIIHYSIIAQWNK